MAFAKPSVLPEQLRVVPDEAAEDGVALRRQSHADAAAVGVGAVAADEAALPEAVHQPDGAMVAQQQAFAEVADLGSFSPAPFTASLSWWCCGSTPAARAAPSLYSRKRRNWNRNSARSS